MKTKKTEAKKLLHELRESISKRPSPFTGMTEEEVRSNLLPKEFHTFIRLINLLTPIDEDFFVPFELGFKYEAVGLKEADALIAAYTEWVGADALVTANRHFLNKR